MSPAGRPIPIEIIARIISHVEEPPASWMTISWAFFETVSDKLYHHAIINSSNDIVSYYDQVKSPPEGIDHLRCQALHGSIKQRLLSKVRILDIFFSHSGATPVNVVHCTGLQHLRYHIDDTRDASEFKRTTRSTYLATHLQCKNVTIRDLPIGMAPIPKFFLWFTPPSLSNLVLVLSPRHWTSTSAPDFSENIRSFLDQEVMFRIENLVIIFKTPSSLDRFQLGSRPKRSIQGVTVFGGTWVEDWILTMTTILASVKSKVTIVNAGFIDEKSANERVWDEGLIQGKLEKVFRREIGRTLLWSNSGRSRELLEELTTKRQAEIRFISMMQYFDHEDWEGVFDRHEVEQWRRGVTEGV